MHIRNSGTRRGTTLVALLGLLLLAAPAAAQVPATRTGNVVGRVVDSLSRPLVGALVSIDSMPSAATTDSAGGFHLAKIPEGEHLLWVRKSGIAPEAFHIAVSANRTKTVLARLTDTRVLLPAVTTRAVGQFGKPARLAYTMKYDDFYRRRALSTAGGLFYTHEDLKRLDPNDLIDVLRRVPSLRIWDNGGTVIFHFPNCGEGGTLIKVDGQTVWSPGGHSVFASSPDEAGANPLDLIGHLHLNQIEAVEVYPTSSSLPVEAVGNACAAIFVWTR